MMRVCHLNTCPVGIATQDPELRKKFTGKPEFVENYFRFVAEEVRELMAELGFRSVDEMVGRVDRLEMRNGPGALEGRPASTSRECAARSRTSRSPRSGGTVRAQDHGLEQCARQSRSSRGRATLGAQAAGRTALPGSQREPHGRARGSGSRSRDVTAARGCRTTRFALQFAGSAGQSFGAFVPAGVTMTLEGDANDFVGKGLSGARLIVYPPRAGAICGRGEHHHRQRRALRRDERRGATSAASRANALPSATAASRAVVEGVGDHGCEQYDGRSRRSCSAHGPQLRCRHERAASLTS